MPEHPAQAVPARPHPIAACESDCLFLPIRRSASGSRMRPLCVVVLEALANEGVEMSRPYHEEPVQTLGEQ